ncbi:MAG TPA: hypothetical protein VF786_06335 [Terriglobales bacterium]
MLKQESLNLSSPADPSTGARTAFQVIAWSSLLFALLQSICTFFAALNGLRVGIGVSSLVLAASTAATIDSFHVDWLRIPMIVLALAGSVLNVLVIAQMRRLRARPSAQWRRSPSVPRKSRSEWTQLGLSVATLILIALEERQHLIWLHHL